MSNLRGMFDSLYIDQLFQTNPKGETVFYPLGLIGNGFIVPGDREVGLRQAVRSRTLLALVSGLSLGTLFSRVAEHGADVTVAGWIALTALTVLVLGGIYYLQYRVAAGLKPSDENISTAQWLERGRANRSRGMNVFRVALGSVAILAGAGATVLSTSEGDYLTMACGIIFVPLGALVAWDGLVGIRERRRQA